MIPAGFALDLRRAEALILAAAPAAAYGAISRVRCERGLYLVMASGAVGVRDAQDGAMRVDSGDGSKLEVHVTESVPLPILIRSGTVMLAARDGKCVAQLIPLVPVTDDARDFVKRACDG